MILWRISFVCSRMRAQYRIKLESNSRFSCFKWNDANEFAGGMQERITTTKKGSITSVQAIYVPADDLTDPAPATTFAHLDATTVLSRGIAELAIYPAVDPLDSTSRIMDPNIVGQKHYDIARGVQKILQDYKSLQVGHASLSNEQWMNSSLCKTG